MRSCVCGVFYDRTDCECNAQQNADKIGGDFVDAPFLLLHVPYVWQGQSYADLHEWLLKTKNLLALGIYRNSLSAVDAELAMTDQKKPSLYYMYTCPPSYETVVYKSDRILVIAPE